MNREVFERFREEFRKRLVFCDKKQTQLLVNDILLKVEYDERWVKSVNEAVEKIERGEYVRAREGQC